MNTATQLPTYVRDYFLADHQRLVELFSRVLDAFKANDRATVGEVWEEFCLGTNAHMDMEEKYLIPHLMKVAKDEAQSLLDEHRAIRNGLKELDDALAINILRLEKTRSFIDLLRMHVRHEDAAIYQWADIHLDPWARSALLVAQTEAIRAKMENTKVRSVR